MRLHSQWSYNSIPLVGSRKCAKLSTIYRNNQRDHSRSYYCCIRFYSGQWNIPAELLKRQYHESRPTYLRSLTQDHQKKSPRHTALNYLLFPPARRLGTIAQNWYPHDYKDEEQDFLYEKYFKSQVLRSNDDDTLRLKKLKKQTLQYLSGSRLENVNDHEYLKQQIKIIEDLISITYDSVCLSKENSNEIRIMKSLCYVWLKSLKKSRLKNIEWNAIKSSTVNAAYTSTPFNKMLQLYAHHKPNQGRKAFQIFKDWLEYFGLEYAPSKNDYDCLLQSYSFVCSTDGDADTEDFLHSLIWEGYQTAIMIPPYVDHSFTTDAANARTYQLVIRNVTNAITLLPHIHDSQNASDNESSKLGMLQKDLELTLKNYCTELKKHQQPGGVKNVFQPGTSTSSFESHDAFVSLAEVVYDCSKAYLTLPLPHPTEWQYLFSVWSEIIAYTNVESFDSEMRCHWDILARSLLSYRYTNTGDSGKVILQAFFRMQTKSVLAYYEKKILPGANDTDEAVIIILSLTRYISGLRSHFAFYDSDMIVPDTQSYENALYILKQWRKNETACEETAKICSKILFDECNQIYRKEYKLLNGEKQTACANNFLLVCVHTFMYDAAFRCWNEMILDDVAQNTLSYYYILRALSEGPNHSTLDRARKAQSIWENLLSETSDCDVEKWRNIQPNASHYASAMAAWSRCNHPTAGDFCLSIFQRMQIDHSHHPHLQLLPSEVHYASLLEALEKSPNPHRIKQIFEDYMMQVERENIRFSATIGKCLLRSCSKFVENTVEAKYCEDLLDKMIAESGLSALRELETACFNFALRAWVRSQDLNASDRCDAIYQKLLHAYQVSNRNPQLLPNSYTYLYLLQSLSNANLRTDIHVGEKSIQILEDMEARWIQNDATKPNANVYAAAMTVLWKKNNPDALDMVENLLSRMKVAYNNGNLEAKPDHRTMAAVMQTWARSNRQRKASKAYEILYQMIQMYEEGDQSMKPSAYDFTTALNACAYTDSTDPDVKAEAFRISLDLFLHIDSGKYGQHSEHTFRYLFQSIFYQTDDELKRDRFAKVAFERCCQTGYVTKHIIGMLRRKAPRLYCELPCDDMGNVNLPDSWIRSTKSKPRSRVV